MLVACGGPSEPAVVGDIQQHFGALVGELPHKGREHGLIADERPNPVCSQLRNDHFRAGFEVAGFGGNLVGDGGEGPGHELAKRYQIHFVIASLNRAIGRNQHGGIPRRLRLAASHGAGDKRRIRAARNRRDQLAEVRIEIIKRQGNFRPHNEVHFLLAAQHRRHGE